MTIETWSRIIYRILGYSWYYYQRALELFDGEEAKNKTAATLARIHQELEKSGGPYTWP